MKGDDKVTREERSQGTGVDGRKAVVTVSPDASVAAVAREMCIRHIGCVVVGDDDGVLGILSERDILNRIVAFGVDPVTTAVGQIMTAEVVSIPPGTALEAAQEIMAANGIRHLPILSNGIPVGIISSRDLILRQLIRNKEMKEAAEQIAMLSTSLKAIDFDEVVNMVTCEIPKLFGADKSVLYLPDGGQPGRTGPLTTRYHCPCSDRHVFRESQPQPEQASARRDIVLDQPPPHCAESCGQSQRVVIPLDIKTDSTDNDAAPTTLQGHVCMCGFDAPAGAADGLIRYKAALVRDVLNTSFRNARAYQETRQHLLTDPLTRVGTRRLFEEKLEAECARNARHRRPFCVGMLDIDGFKAINDRLGPRVADEALVRLGAHIARHKRTEDILARYGGDEFVILLPETDREGAIRLMERIREEVKYIDMPDGVTLTVSCGVAGQQEDCALAPNELVHRADLALYQAKKRGRDRTETWDEIAKEADHQSDSQNRKVKQLQVTVADLSNRSKEMFVQSIWGLAQALEARDPYTKSHSENVMRYAVGIAETLGTRQEDVHLIRRAAMVHDIGKIGVPDAVLRKPGELNHGERKVMERHPLIAIRILGRMRFLEREMPIVRHHHERWDGGGYPDGIAGAAIPTGARILAVADAFDAITSNRVYSNAKSLPDAVNILREESGRQFDPQAADAMRCWIRTVERKLELAGKLTPQQLLATQKTCVLAA